MIDGDLAPVHIAALCALEAAERLYLFPSNGDVGAGGRPAAFKAAAAAVESFDPEDIMLLVQRGLARESRVCVFGAISSVVITLTGEARILRGAVRAAGAA
jgi:hypothetical protein